MKSLYKLITLFLIGSLLSIAQRSYGVDRDKPVNAEVRKEFVSRNGEGLIGITEDSPIDNPVDNIFHVTIPEALCGEEKVWLVYDLEGVADHTSVSRSINDQIAVGGYLVKRRRGWATQREQVNAAWLKDGDNVVRFTMPENAQHSYRIKNLRFEVESTKATSDIQVVFNQPTTHYFFDKAYVKGFITGAGYADVQIKIDGKAARTFNGEFESILDFDGAQRSCSAEVEVIYPDGTTTCDQVTFSDPQTADFNYALEQYTYRVEKFVDATTNASLSLHGATLSTLEGALKASEVLSITTLRAVDIAALDGGMVNVTANAAGFRFLPHGTIFTKEVNVVIPFDPEKIPDGYTEKDIKTYYFDELSHHWVPLAVDTVLLESGKVISRTTHFTDLINGIIKVPESPEAEAYNSTSIKGIKAANPTAAVNLINPPQANNTGNASLAYPLNLPTGRNGMQPQLTVSYGSSGGNGWMGLGWNISIPAISIDTRWGVPRFDPTNETETYSFNGEQLSPVAHRGALRARNKSIDTVRFYPRVEGAFNKIIRHGTEPSNYWWEVIDKGGTRYFYGATKDGGLDKNAVLRDKEKSDGGNVAHWALREVRDLNGNGVQYHYAKVMDTGLASTTNENEKEEGYQLYIDRISYTEHNGGDGKYEVLFTRDREVTGQPFVRRADVSIAGNLGFKQVTADLLKRIDIVYDKKQPVRSYVFAYKTGEFFKTLLESISELDAAGQPFTKHELEYYNEVKAGTTYAPFGTAKTWTVPGDEIRGHFKSSVSKFTDEATVLSGTKSTDKSVGTTISVGFNVLVFNKSTSVGGSFGYAQSKSDGVTVMSDMNGDGLQDKVYARGNNLYYMPNLSAVNGGTSFGSEKSISGVDAFYKEKSKTINYGAEALFGAFVGVNRSNTTSTTSVYLTDVNGDQLPDIVRKGVVLFNHIDTNTGNITYTRESEGTPSKIISGGGISDDLLDKAVLEQERQDAINKNPLHDVVRMWQAPFDGTINVSGPVQLLKSDNQERAETPADGVRVAIQLMGTELWNKNIAPDDYSEHLPGAVSSLVVKQNDKLFFRVGSRDNGSYDSVRWEPVVEYLDKTADLKDANRKPVYKFSSKADHVLASKQQLSPPINGRVTISGPLEKPYTTDSVHFVILRKNEAGVIDTVWNVHYSWDEKESMELNEANVPVKENEEYFFKVLSKTNIDWAAIKWQPKMKYTSSDDPTIDISKSVIEAYGVPEYSMLPKVLHFSDPFKIEMDDNTNDTLTVSPVLTFREAPFFVQPFTGDVVFSVKKTDTLLAKQIIKVVNGQVTGDNNDLLVPVRNEDSIFVEYHIPSAYLASGLTTAEATLVGLEIDTEVTASVYTEMPNLGEHEEFIFGPLWRGWGHFAWKANREFATQPININKLKTSQKGKDQKEINTDNMSGEQLDGMDKYDASGDDFIILVASGQNQRWNGYDQFTYLTGSLISSSRLGEDDLSELQVSTGDNTGARGIDKISKSNATAFSVSASIGGVGGGKSLSSGDSKVLTDFMDMNGDRYPDIVSERIIQYTDALGGMSTRTISSGGNVQQSHSETDGYTLSGSGAMPMPKFKGSSKDQKQSRTDAGDAKSVGFSISGSVSAVTGTNNAEITWMDVNGDGLPDRVDMSGKKVALNIGYGFTEYEYWGFDEIQAGSSDTKSGGASIGFTKGQGSISGGISLARSDNNSEKILQDVNGDGLPDLVTKGSPLKVRLNKGGSFASQAEEILWHGATTINENATASESANVAFTVGFTLWGIKWTVNPSGSYGHGMSREISKLVDMDGDGFPDVVRSTAATNLTVAPSKIGRTNLLKGVKRPLGATFRMTYARVGNTYEMPNSMWVLDSVEVFDGYAGDGVDKMLTSYTYEGGFHDRHEREFYGFKNVITRTHDTSKGGKPAYTIVNQKFKNDNFYDKGLMENEVLTDGAGNKFVEKENIYQLKDVKSGANLPASAKTNDAGMAFPALIETKQKFYEGGDQAGKSTSTTFGYNVSGDITSFTDFGDEGSEDDLSASISYHSLRDKHVLSVPERVVITGSGRTYRKRESVINESGDVIQIKQFLDDTNFSAHDMEYDAYGNLIKITRPKNGRDQRLSFTYEYDAAVHSYQVKIGNSYGYSSESTFDFRFGHRLISKDINGNEIKYELDNHGRTKSITGPYEKGGANKTIEFEYHPEAMIPWALTKHYDPANPSNKLQTAIFVDGLGRVLQTKKDVALHEGDGKADTEMMAVSGRVFFDAFGRTVTAHYPTTGAASTPGEFMKLEDKDAPPTITTYDVMNRILAVTLPDLSVTTTAYGFEQDKFGNTQFSTKTTDANGKQTEQLQTLDGLVTSVKNHTSDKAVWTSFKYNAMGEQIEATDDLGHTTFSFYDNLGRRIRRQHPDAGTSHYRYDFAGNMTEHINSNLEKEGLAILYSYNFERLVEISYPKNPENNVKYTYGEAGASENRAGRIVLQEDATGAQEFFYGPLGEVVKNIRTIVIPQHDEQTYVTEWQYDTWNRLTSMTYADGEKVEYNYNVGGLLKSMIGKKKNATYSYVNQLGYDKFEQRVFLAYGNGTKTTYSYETDRRRLKNMTAQTAAKRAFMNNDYTYDRVDNILNVKNSAPIPASNLMGGASEYSYNYDDLYRLTSAQGTYKGSNDEHTYALSLSYNTVGGITQKTQSHLRKGQEQKKTSYNLSYTYGDTQPHAPKHIGEHSYTYDASGNQTGWTHDVSGQRRRMMWDEENRLRAVYDNGALYHYIYDAAGERVLKGQSTGQRVFVNGEWKAGSGQMGNYTVYVNPYLVLKSGGYTKHYYIEGQRIVSKLGGGWDNSGKGPLKAGNGKIDYVTKGERIFAGIVKNLKFLGADGQILTAGKSGKVPPGQINGTSGNVTEAFRYFYHPDHLGNTSYITDASGEVYQHLEYFVSGETFVEEHSNVSRTPYLFNGKELDEETGLYYYGARYYDPRTSVFVSVDPMADNFPSLTPYQFAGNRGPNAIDLDGLEPITPQGWIPANLVVNPTPPAPPSGWRIPMSPDYSTTTTKVEAKKATITTTKVLTGEVTETKVINRNYDTANGKNIPTKIDTKDAKGNAKTVSISFLDTKSDKQNSNNKITPTAVEGFVATIKKANEMGAGIEKLSVSATTNGEHTGGWFSGSSHHYKGSAIDIGLINGKAPSASDSLVQMAADSTSTIVENFGPKFDHKKTKTISDQKHNTWIHLSFQ